MREDKTKYKVEGVLDDRLLVVRYVNAGSFLRAAGNAKDQGLSGIFSIEHMSAGVKLQGTDMVNQFLEDYRKEANEPAIQEVVQELEKQEVFTDYDNEEVERIKLEKEMASTSLKERLIEQQYDNVYSRLKKSTNGCAYINDGLLAETIERIRATGFVVKAIENDDESITYLVKTH